METAWEGPKISAPLYVLPFVFVYHPEVVSGEFTATSLSAGFIAMLGALAVIHGINYRFAFGRGGTAGARVVFFVLGIVAMVHPDLFVQIGALAAAVGLYAVQKVVGEPELGVAGAAAADGRSDPSDTDR